MAKKIVVVSKEKCDKHEERTPSKHIYSDGSWICYGCGAKGKA
jgi:DNA primase